MQPAGNVSVPPEDANLAGLPEREDLESLDALLTDMLARSQAELDRLAVSAS